MNAQTMRPGAVQFHVTHDWNGQPLPQDLTIWVSPRPEPIRKQLKPDCPCTQFWQMVLDHPQLKARYSERFVAWSIGSLLVDLGEAARKALETQWLSQ